MVMIPALDTSAHTTSALGRMLITQKSMILARDLATASKELIPMHWKSKNIRGVSLICVSLMK